MKIRYLCSGSSYRVKSGMPRKLAYAAGVSGREDEEDQDSHEDIVAVDLGEADRAAAVAELGGDDSDDEEEKDTPVNAALMRAKGKERKRRKESDGTMNRRRKRNTRAR